MDGDMDIQLPLLPFPEGPLGKASQKRRQGGRDSLPRVPSPALPLPGVIGTFPPGPMRRGDVLYQHAREM